MHCTIWWSCAKVVALVTCIRRQIGGLLPFKVTLIEQQTACAPDNPAMIGEAFPAHPLRPAAFTQGMDPLDSIRVDDAEDGWGGQEGLCPVVMRREETQEPGPLGEVGKQRPRVARQPAIEGAVADAFECVTALR